jgi:RecA-family ATPase
LLAGAPGTGKTTTAMALAATVSCGGKWPDGSECEGGHVLIWTGEDDPNDVLVPRLMAAGADRDRVHFVRGVRSGGETRDFDPAKDIPGLCDKADTIRPRLLILDPIGNAVSGDSHRNNEVRRALAPLVRLAETCRIAVVGITHFSKSSAGRDPLERVTGSVAFGALARIVLVTAKINGSDGADSRVLARAKSNLGVDSGGFAYALEQVSILEGTMEATRVRWGEAIKRTARDLLAEAESPDDDASDVRTEIAEWLRDILRTGPLPESEVRKLAQEQGFKWHTVKRSKRRAGVRSYRDGFGKGGRYLWQLSEEDPSSHGEHGVQPQKTVLHVSHGADERVLN